MALSCLPISICSWNYRIVDKHETLAILNFNIMSEQGSIEHNGYEMEIRKHGVFSGTWSLELHGEELLTAVKPSAFSRSFTISSGDERFEVSARTLSRAFDINQGEIRFGQIEPTHWFTRRAKITAEDSVPALVQMFAFWVVAMQWRRQQNSSS